MEAELLGVEDVAAMLGRSPFTIRHWISSGAECGPAFRRVGKRRMARRADVNAWLDAKFAAPEAK